jgi:hypothetical protein
METEYIRFNTKDLKMFQKIKYDINQMRLIILKIPTVVILLHSPPIVERWSTAWMRIFIRSKTVLRSYI